MKRKLFEIKIYSGVTPPSMTTDFFVLIGRFFREAYDPFLEALIDGVRNTHMHMLWSPSEKIGCRSSVLDLLSICVLLISEASEGNDIN